jgi:hypothetical protein
MPTDRPTASELLEALREFLADNVAPNLEGQLAFHVQVAVNVLGIIERTLEHGSTMDAEELQRLQELLGSDGSLLELNQELSDRISSGELDDRKEQVFEHLLETVKDKLHLANPRYLKKAESR